MKTAISLPDELFREIDASAKALNLSRSAFLARAAREYIARRRAVADATMAWNQAIAEAGQPEDEPAAAAARRRTKATIRKGNSRSGW